MGEPLDAYMFWPGFIQPVRGVKSRTRLYRAMYAAGAACYPVLPRVAPKFVTTSETLARAILSVAARGGPQRILDTADINVI